MINWDTDEQKVKKLLNKAEARTISEFKDILDYACDKFKNQTIINQYLKEFLENEQGLQYDITVSKTKKVEQKIEVSKLPDDETLKQMMGEEEMEAYKKKFELMQNVNTRVAVKMATVEQQIPIKIWMNYDTGLYVAEAEIYKNFLYNTDKLYSFGKIASFLGLELNVKEIKSGARKDIYLTFIKNYSELEFIGIQHFFDEPKTDSEIEFFNSKKLLTIEQVKKDIEIGINKVIEFSNIVEDIIKQLKSGGI